MMGTHWHVFKLGLQNTAGYRTNFLFRALFNLVPLISALALWRAIFDGGKETISGYTLAEMLSYYLIVALVEMTTAVTEDEWQVATDIKDGGITQFLVRPVGYLRYRVCLFSANRVIYTAVAFIPMVGIIAWNHQYLLPPANVLSLVGFVCSLVFAAGLQFLLAYLTSLLAFWVLEISTFSFMLLAAQRIASGEMFPLDLLPHWLTQALMVTPFPYCMFFPVSVYMGRLSEMEMAQGLAMQALWIAVLFALASFVWNRGLRTYTAVGG
jgi:ABC-2 type transport system permease protein